MSTLNGEQSFQFTGYVPVPGKDLVAIIEVIGNIPRVVCKSILLSLVEY